MNALPHTILVDIDNTLCVNEGPFGKISEQELKDKLKGSSLMDAPTKKSQLHSREAQRIAHLIPLNLLCNLIKTVSGKVKIWYITSRPEWLRESTLKWLISQSLPLPGQADVQGILFRQNGDRRGADLVKLELFEKQILPNNKENKERILLIDDNSDTRSIFEEKYGIATIDPDHPTKIAELERVIRENPDTLLSELLRQVSYQIGRFDSKRYSYQRTYYLLLVSQSVFALITTVLVGWNTQNCSDASILRNYALVVSGGGAFLALLVGTFNIRDQWVSFTGTSSRLKAFKARLELENALINAGKRFFITADEAAQIFDEFQGVLSSSNAEWQSLMHRESTTPTPIKLDVK